MAESPRGRHERCRRRSNDVYTFKPRSDDEDPDERDELDDPLDRLDDDELDDREELEELDELDDDELDDDELDDEEELDEDELDEDELDEDELPDELDVPTPAGPTGLPSQPVNVPIAVRPAPESRMRNSRLSLSLLSIVLRPRSKG